VTEPVDDSKKVQLHIRIPVWLKDFLQKKAEERGMTMTEFILQYIHQLWSEEQQQGFASDMLSLKDGEDGKRDR
jgi:macrodomain Ter protein organizer (MatP/YcbG family)